MQLDGERMHVTKENQRGAEPKVSFEIWVEKLGTEAASFKGSLRKDSGEAREWRGSFVYYRDTPLDVIRAGPQDMPPKAKTSSISIPGRSEEMLIMQSLPDEAKDILYQNNIRNPDEDVRGTIARSQDFPEAVKWRIHPRSIFEQYGRSDQTSILHLIAIHVMVRDIEQQNWLNFAQKTRLRVLTGQLFDLLHYKGNDLGTEEFNNLCRAYGPMRRDPRRAVWEYRNVLRQCYFSEYVERASKWDSIPKDPSASWTEIRQYLMSDEYLEHWLPTIIDSAENQLEVSLKNNMEILGDKLYFLQSAAQTGEMPGTGEAEQVVQKLLTSALQTGLVHDTMVSDFKSENMNARTLMQLYLRRFNS
ncbi:hypothetical protein N0V87_000469 [Didymella glomerata]|uniref:Uncharacterized protein n=1 Tax=Didymella glomerata TaxID=749621 RepID=A0A9W9C477_9PLEO|nr:hypothetical protein N0V87_000469 [Didymella glomerata]